MSDPNPQPKWWRLYLVLPFLIALFLLEGRLHVSPRGHTLLQLGILVLVYAWAHLWLRANATALEGRSRAWDRGGVRVIRLSVPGLDARQGHRPLFQLPQSEDKNLLPGTFEMDYYIDAESFPVDNVSHESDGKSK